jgi:hypothetical protein
MPPLPYLNFQDKLFRKRIAELYHARDRILGMAGKRDQYHSLLTAFNRIEDADNRFVKNTLTAQWARK